MKNASRPKPNTTGKPDFVATPSSLGELRQDITTGDWVVIATSRADRPHDFSSDRSKPATRPKYKDDCPFCNLSAFPQQPDTLRLPDSPDHWQVHIFGNKYPAFIPKNDFRIWNEGPHRTMEAVGYHEVLATRVHSEIDGVATTHQLSLQLEALVLRYRQLKTKPSVSYIQIIKNHGKEAGGSLEHPHHQIFTTPIIPNDVAEMLNGAEQYGSTHNQSPFTALVAHELQDRSRLVYENDHFAVICPYASRVPFESWIIPKEEDRFFEDMGPSERELLADAMQQLFKSLYIGLNDPPYNYYIHSAPCDTTGLVCKPGQFKHFRWHVEVLPRLTTFGGFELGTGLEINITSPETAAELLRAHVSS